VGHQWLVSYVLLAIGIIVKYIGGVMILTCVDSCSNANGIVHTSRGSFGYILLLMCAILLVLLLCLWLVSYVLLALGIIVKYIGGVMILTCVDSCSNANSIVHTSRGSFGYIFYFIVLISSKSVCCHQTPKRGRLKEHFPNKCILVFVINIW
jgi:hypothetical protein